MPKKNSSAPKRALSAFMFFSNHRRPDINKQQPNLKIGDVAKIIGAEWKKLSEEEKKVGYFFKILFSLLTFSLLTKWLRRTNSDMLMR